MTTHVPVIVIGGGQAGLSISAGLTDRGVEHLVLERHSVGHEWRERRWDSFCLVTPNWQCQLPGFPYRGDDPHGFMVRDEIVAYLEAYAASFGPPLMEGLDVTRLAPGDAGGFALDTTAGEFSADQVVLATGPYHAPRRPALAGHLPAGVTQLHSSEYRNPETLPDGAVVVVGTGQSGCQIAEDLHLAGRRVHLAVGSAPRVARFYRGRDVVAWLDELGHYDLPIEKHPEGMHARDEPNHYVTGRDGGHDIDLRAFALEGMQLHGRLTGVRGSELTFAADLRHNLAQADATSERIKDTIDRHIEARAIRAPTEARYTPVWEPGDEPETTLDLAAADIGSVVWSTGYIRDYRFVDLPAFDGAGYPTHARGVTTVPGLYVLGLPWLHTWGSGRFAGIARDATHLAARITARGSVGAGVRRTAAVGA